MQAGIAQTGRTMLAIFVAIVLALSVMFLLAAPAARADHDSTTTTVDDSSTTTVDDSSTTTVDDSSTTTVDDSSTTTVDDSSTTTDRERGTTTTPPPTTPTPTDEVLATTITAAPTTVEVDPVDTLPFTGVESGTYGLLAMALIGIGALTLTWARGFRVGRHESPGG